MTQKLKFDSKTKLIYYEISEKVSNMKSEGQNESDFTFKISFRDPKINVSNIKFKRFFSKTTEKKNSGKKLSS